ncbi:MAG: molybdopterin cofactor-binding domain-containing protein [Miniphocaeibacter sp.]|uniref:xanthine dehydrogenase family protein molybdopterin-binding subunit n=1 Tax=Miniphocaeibacter sp. TaxID=3100973 RepID=UPI003BB09D15
MKEKIIGKGYPIRDSVLKATGHKIYVDDMKLPNMLYGKILYSPIAHGKVKSIDTTEAMKVEGVKAIATCFNTPHIKYNSALRFYDHDIPFTETVFSKNVRFVGDRVAAVAAETMEAAEQAVNLIKVEYEELPPIFDVEEAAKENAYPIHPGGNVLNEIKANAGDVEKGFAQAYKIYEDRYEVQPVNHGALEPHTCIAQYTIDNRLTVHSSCQNVFAFRVILSQILEMPLHKIRMITPSIGGSFGGKLEMTIEPVAAILSKMTMQPVKVTLTRKEVFKSTRTRHAAVMYIKTGVKENGEIVAQDFNILLNTGSYASSCYNVLGALSHKIYKVYKIPNLRFRGVPVYTNIPIAGAMRGYGSPQIFFAQQAQMGKIARDLNIDLVELQKINAALPDGVDQRFNSPLGNPRILDCLKEGSEIFEWERKKKIVGEKGYRHGVGMAIGAHGNGVFGAHRDYISLALKLNEDGTTTLLTGVHDMGNGSVTLQTQMIAEVLGITPDKVETLEADTDAVPWNLGDYASRGLYVEGAAAKRVAEKLKSKIVELAEEILKTKDLVLENGYVVSQADSSRKISLSDIAVYSQKEKEAEITVVESHRSEAGITSYGVHFAEVLVEEKTGKIKVISYTACHDSGKVINPLAATNQLDGGIHMGLGYALTEDYVFDDKGNMTNDSFGSYKMFRAHEMPEIKTHFVKGFEETGPYGGKSIGECAVVPAAPAILNAVYDATGIEIKKLPIKINKEDLNG